MNVREVLEVVAQEHDMNRFLVDDVERDRGAVLVPDCKMERRFFARDKRVRDGVQPHSVVAGVAALLRVCGVFRSCSAAGKKNQ
jgi:hypothetical protein